jgi:hypothetical protein
MRNLFFIVALLLPCASWGQSAPMLQDFYYECQRHLTGSNPASVTPGQPGTYSLGYEGCIKISQAWNQSAAGQQVTATRLAIKDNPDLISQFVQANGL